MWLLNVRTRRLQEFMTDKPHYVILSHTWAEEEVSFRDMHEVHDESIQNKAGYQKILKCCEQALLAGFAWVWIDTCCINKESSAELTEAINSMYTWYWEAEICYAFLVDVGAGDESVAASEGLTNSNWFNRGWTLQELLAPSVVEFYNYDWIFIGTKSSLVASIAQATGIETIYLLDREVVSDATVGTRFSWASRRVTTRSEDIAYCLLGLFGVHMPMLYGEGTRAFYRLQLEIINSSSDHTIFAWDPQPSDAFDAMGILAPSPKQFVNASIIRPVNIPRTVPVERVYSTYNITNRGLRISLPKVDGLGSSRIGLLNCRLIANTSRPYIGIQLQDNPKEKPTYGTTHVVSAMSSKLVYLNRSEASYNYPYSVHIQAETRLLRPIPAMSAKMKVDFVRVDFPIMELRNVVVVAEEDDNCRWLIEEEKTAERTFVIVGNTMGITLSIGSDTFAIVVGYTGDRITLGVLPWTPGKTLDEHSRAVKLLGDTRKFNLIPDYAACSLTPAMQIVAFARKIGTKHGVMWTAVVQIIDQKSRSRPQDILASFAFGILDKFTIASTLLPSDHGVILNILRTLNIATSLPTRRVGDVFVRSSRRGLPLQMINVGRDKKLQRCHSRPKELVLLHCEILERDDKAELGKIGLEVRQYVLAPTKPEYTIPF